MELELRKEEFDCYQPCTTLVAAREETEETIVPDHCPDVSRIVDVSPCLLLRSNTIADGKLAVSGIVKLHLLYLSEDAQEPRALEYAVPFDHSFDGATPAKCMDAAVEGRVCNVEVRLLNPRKLFTKLEIEWKASPYCPSVLSTCGEIADQAQYAIETLCENHTISLVRLVHTKDFIFSEEMTLPGGREPIRELLSPRVQLRVSEAKSVGNKVILKGVAHISLVYLSESGNLCSYAEELPFSQILEGIPEDNGPVTASVILNLTDCEIYADGDDGRTVNIKLFLNAFLVVRQSVTVGCITDLYSIAYDLDVQTENIPLWRLPEHITLTQSVREQLDTSTEVRSVLETDVCFSSISVKQTGAKSSVHATAHLSVLYLDEGGVPLTTGRHIELNAETETVGELDVESICVGDIAANINSDGIELRFPVEFTLVSTAAPVCACLTRVSAEEPEDQQDDMPSLVLRAMSAGQRLWDIAKQYRTTVEEILSANELNDDTAVDASKMLLIPRKR